MQKKIDVKNKMYYAVPEDKRHIYRVKFNPANGIYFITNTKTGIVWELLAGAFVCGNPSHNDLTNKFPNYVHGQVWLIDEYHFQVRVNSKRGK